MSERRRGSWLDAIERIGNLLPDPVTLFMIGAVGVLVLSEVAVQMQWSVVNPVDDKREVAISLIRQEGLQWVWLNLISNFTGFAPLGVVLVGMIGIGLAERSGLIGAILKTMVLITPRALVTPAVLFVGVMSSMALDAGYIVLPPLAAAVFMSTGRSPVVGLAAVFAGVGAGFSANLLITGLDPLLQSFTQTAAQITMPDYQVDVRCNYYFMIASTFMITGIGWAVTKWIVEPRFSADDVAAQIAAFQLQEEAADEEKHKHVTRTEIVGMIVAFIAFAGATAAVVGMIVTPGGALYGTTSPRPGWDLEVWVQAIVPILFVLFFVPGLAYGIAAGTIKSDREMASMMGKTMASMGPYIVLAFFAAQFVSWFDHSNLGKLLALKGVEILRTFDMPPSLLVVAIVMLSAALNLFVGSASAKWALISTVFVPIFAGVGVSPELTQAAYRVGDSVTNSIAPLNPYMVIMLVFLQRYVPRAGIGTLISVMLPYTIALLVGWLIMLMIWMALGSPLGPGGGQLFIEPMGGA